MKKVLFTLTLILSTLLFSSCEDPAISNGRKLYKAYFNHILKDPGSFCVYKEEYEKEEKYGVIWTLDYGAKNSIGGMVRKTATFTTTANYIFINGTHYKMEDLK